MTLRQRRNVKAILLIGAGMAAGVAIGAAVVATGGAVLVPVIAGAGAASTQRILGSCWTTKDGTEICHTDKGTTFSDAYGFRGPYSPS